MSLYNVRKREAVVHTWNNAAAPGSHILGKALIDQQESREGDERLKEDGGGMGKHVADV